MKTSARFILSSVTGLGLVACTVISAFTFGAAATSTVIAFSLLSVFGLVEIAVLSYTPRRFVVRPVVTVRPATVTRRNYVRVPALVEVPAAAYTRRAA